MPELSRERAVSRLRELAAQTARDNFEMGDIALDQCTVGVDSRVGAQVQSARRLGVVGVDPGGAHGDQPDAALGPRGEIVAGAFRRQPVRRAVHGLHRRHHQPVAQRHRADLARLQQVWKVRR